MSLKEHSTFFWKFYNSPRVKQLSFTVFESTEPISVSILSFRRNNQRTLLLYHEYSRRSDISWGLSLRLAGDYFQALRYITAPAALMVRQQSSLIITPEWEYSS